MGDTTLRISEELHTSLKIEAARQRRTLQEVTAEAVQEWLDRQVEATDD